MREKVGLNKEVGCIEGWRDIGDGDGGTKAIKDTGI